MNTEDARLITEIVRRVPMAPVLYADLRKALHKRTWPHSRIQRALQVAVDQGLLVMGMWHARRSSAKKVHVSYSLPPNP